MIYKLINNLISNQPSAVMRYNDNGSVSSIPFDPANMDFVEYNKWLSLGNQPLPPDAE
jgi:hypothetical protein